MAASKQGFCLLFLLISCKNCFFFFVNFEKKKKNVVGGAWLELLDDDKYDVTLYIDNRVVKRWRDVTKSLTEVRLSSVFCFFRLSINF